MTMSNRPENSSLWQSNIAAIGNTSVEHPVTPPPMALDRHISAASAAANHLVVSFDDYESLCGEKEASSQQNSLAGTSQSPPRNNPRNHARRSMPSDAFGRLTLQSASAISPMPPPSRRASWAFDPTASVRKNAAAAASLAIEKRKTRMMSRRDSGGGTSSGDGSRELMQSRIRRARSRSPTADRPPRGDAGFETSMTSFETSFASPRDFMRQQDSSRGSSSSRLGGAERAQPSHPFGEAKRASDSAPYSLALTAALNVASNTVASSNAILASRTKTSARRGSQQTMSAVIKMSPSTTTANTSTPRSSKIQPLHHLEHKKSSFSTATTTSMSTSATHSTASCTITSPVGSPVRPSQPKVLRGNSFESVQRLYETKSRHNLMTLQVSQESRAVARRKAAAALERGNNESSRSLGRRTTLERNTTTADAPFGSNTNFPSFHGASSSREPSEVNSDFPEMPEEVLPQLSPRCVMLIRQRSREQLGCEQQEEVKERPKRRPTDTGGANRKSREVDPDPPVDDWGAPASPRRSKARPRSVSPGRGLFESEKRETPRKGTRDRIRRQGSRDDVTGRRKEQTNRSASPTRIRPPNDRQTSDRQLLTRKNNTQPTSPRKTNAVATLPRQSSLRGFRNSAPSAVGARARAETAASEDNALVTVKAFSAATRVRAETAFSEDNVLVADDSKTVPKKKVMVLVSDHAKLPFQPNKTFRILNTTEKEETSKSRKKRVVPRPSPLRSVEMMSKGARPPTPPLPSRTTRLSRRQLLHKQQSAPRNTSKKPSEIELPRPDENRKSLSRIERFNESGDLSVLTEPTFTGLSPFTFEDDFGTSEETKERYNTEKFYESGDLSLLTEPTFEAPPNRRTQPINKKKDRSSKLESSLEQLVQRSPAKGSKKGIYESFEPCLDVQSPKYSSDDFMRNSLAQQLRGGFHDSGDMSMLTDPTFGFADDSPRRSSVMDRFNESGDMSLLTEPTFEDYK